MLEVDETFTTILIQGHPRSGSRSGDDLSPLSGLFFVACNKQTVVICRLLTTFATVLVSW